ncbi:MAG: hypothetical protein ACPGIA_04405 [Luteolibacter sp.]
MKKHILMFITLAAACLSLSSCWVLAAYYARDKGMKVQSPVTNDGGGGDEYNDQYEGY